MTYQAGFPPELGNLEYVRLYLHLRLKESVVLPAGSLMQLRRELLSALKLLEEGQGGEKYQALRQALNPQAEQDAHLRRRVQKSGATVILSPEEIAGQQLIEGNEVCLPMLFLGDSMLVVPHFFELLDRLGELGLYKGTGRFELSGIESEDASGCRSLLWRPGEDRSLFAPPLSDLGWWLELQGRATESMEIEFISPARLISHGRPLFKPDFAAVFPFILRRVSQVLGQHLKAHLIEDSDALFDLVKGLEPIANSLSWKDWRILSGSEDKQGLGGIVGSLTLGGGGLGELLWILQLGSLFNLGKGASFGAGQYRLIEA